MKTLKQTLIGLVPCVFFCHAVLAQEINWDVLPPANSTERPAWLARLAARANAGDTNAQRILTQQWSQPRSGDKKTEIRRLFQLTHVQEGMDKTTSQAIENMKAVVELPAAFWTRFQAKCKARKESLLELLIPVYEKYYTLEDT